MIFLDRSEAGRRLAGKLDALRPHDPAVVVLPPGGVRIGFEIATRLGAPMDVLVAQQVTVPGSTHQLLGVVADGHFYPDECEIRRRRVSADYAERLAEIEAHIEAARERSCRRRLPVLDLQGRDTIVVDDGSASEALASGVVHSLWTRGVSAVFYAAPVVTPPVFTALCERVRFVTLYDPIECRSVSMWYEGFSQTTDDETAALMTATRHEAQEAGALA